MKYQLFTYSSISSTSGGPRAGLVVADHRLDLDAAAKQAGLASLSGQSLDDLLDRWNESQPVLRKLATRIADDGNAFASARIDPAHATVRPPFTRTGTIYGAGANYLDHVVAMSKAFGMNLVLDPRAEGILPWHFIKSARATVSGHQGDIPYPARTERLDWEAELAVVIGRRASHVPVDRALEYVAGYMCANDVSARDHLVRSKVDTSSPFRYDWIGHKNFTGACPLGPVFTPAEFVETPEKLWIKLWINGELRQDSNTSNHLYSVAEQVAHLSERLELFPGDLILTGTPAGVGMETGTFLQRGDVMRVAIEGLGELENRIV